LTQVGLIKRIISALGIEHEPICHTPALEKPLTKDLDGNPPDCSFNYASVIGMLGYLQSKSRPDPMRSHEEAAQVDWSISQRHNQRRIGASSK
jgi:hypothetical protein